MDKVNSLVVPEEETDVVVATEVIAETEVIEVIEVIEEEEIGTETNRKRTTLTKTLVKHPIIRKITKKEFSIKKNVYCNLI